MVNIADENTELARNAGAVDTLVAAMRTHADKACFSKQACFAMGNFCCNGVLLALMNGALCAGSFCYFGHANHNDRCR